MKVQIQDLCEYTEEAAIYLSAAVVAQRVPAVAPTFTEDELFDIANDQAFAANEFGCMDGGYDEESQHQQYIDSDKS